MINISKIEISYIRDEKLLHTSLSNDDIELSEVIDTEITIKIKALNDIILDKAILFDIFKISKNDQFFLNGYQSWSKTNVATLKDKERDVSKLPSFILDKVSLVEYGDTFIYDYNKNKLHGYDFFYLKGENELFSFNLNYEYAYLIYDIDKKKKTLSLISDVKGLHLKKGEVFTLFNFLIYDSISEGLNVYSDRYPKKEKEKIFGYTSWYNYYDNINEEILLRDLESLDERFNLFQIDDGYTEHVGDWQSIDKVKFPNGLKGIVDKVHEKGKLAGIWIAPFAASVNSDIVKKHPEYFIKVNGEFLKAGSNWGGFYTYDLDNTDARRYIKECLEYLMDLGFDFFKLDFLYASSLVCKDDKTRAMVARRSYEFLRDILKDKLILGCGSVISSSIDLFDYMRVGPDVLINLDNKLLNMLGISKISMKMTLKNTIYRSIFNNHLFLNDPDVFTLRDDACLSLKQKEAIYLINSLFSGILLTSDNIGIYSETEKAMLDEVYDIYMNSSDEGFILTGDLIKIFYRLHNKDYYLVYNTKKGVMTNGR